MAEKQIRYGAGGKIYYKDIETPAEPKDEVISEILTENPNEVKEFEIDLFDEDKETKKEKKNEKL